jgi:hypothetical protein
MPDQSTDNAALLNERAAFEQKIIEEAGNGAITRWLSTQMYESHRVNDYRMGWLWCLEWIASNPKLIAELIAAHDNNR